MTPSIDQEARPEPSFPFLDFQDREALEDYKLHRRFDRMGRLIGDPKMKRLMDAHVMVVGLGGVGSYAAESIVRSGVGKVTIIDFDLICITNVNRQLHAMQGVIGKPKSEVLAERFRKINPRAEILPMRECYNQETSEKIFDLEPDFIIDAIDSVAWKCHLLHACLQKGVKAVSSSGAAGRLDPTQIRVADLADTRMDHLARSVRKIMRQKYGYSRDRKFGVPTVYSLEPATKPEDLIYDNGQGFRCVCPQGQNDFFTCDNRNLIMGTAGFVTGAFGFACSSVAIRELIAG